MGRKKKPPPEPTCDVCGNTGKLESICVPGVPLTLAYCEKCLNENRHPWEVLVGQTALAETLENTDEFWQRMVFDTLKATGKSREEFDKEVKDLRKQIEGIREF